jgi:Leucine Rich repeat
MTKLSKLTLGSADITGTGLEHLKGMTELTDLNLSDSPVTDAGLEHLKRLASLSLLDLNESQVTDAGLAHLKGLTSLYSLGLSLVSFVVFCTSATSFLKSSRPRRASKSGSFSSAGTTTKNTMVTKELTNDALDAVHVAT